MPEISIIVPPYSVFFASGTPLEFGKIYIGTAGLDPRENPIALYSDEAFTVPVAQPVRTAVGHPVDGSNTPISIYIGVTSYSILVKNKNDETVYSNLNAKPAILAQQATLEAYVDTKLAEALPSQQTTLETYIDSEVEASLTTQQAELEAYVDTALTAALPEQETALKEYVDAEITTALAQQRLHIRDEKISGVNGDSVPATTWTKLALNTQKVNTITGAVLSADQITLPAGTYRLRLSVPFYGRKASFKVRWFNVIDAATVDVGYPVYTPSDGDNDHRGQMRSELYTSFTISEQKIFQAQIYANIADGFVGWAYDTGEIEVFTDLELFKVDD